MPVHQTARVSRHLSQFLQTSFQGVLPKRPLVLVGPRWRALFKCFAAQLIPTPDIFEPMTLVDTPEQAAEFLRESFGLEPHAPPRAAI